MAKTPGKTKAPKKLKPREARFVVAYARGRSGTQAVIDAGYTENRASAGSTAYRLLNAPAFAHVQAAIDEHTRDTCQVLRDLRKIAIDSIVQMVQFRPGRAYDKNGELLPIPELCEEDQSCIAQHSVKKFKGGESTTVRFINRPAVTIALCKMTGLMGARVDDQQTDEDQVRTEVADLFEALEHEGEPGPVDEEPAEEPEQDLEEPDE